MISKSWNKAAYELAPTTGRRARTLAKNYGHKQVKDMADSIPEGADVLDVGAGLSNLGKTMAKLRPDISWINLDLRYDRRMVRARASIAAPDNLQLVSANALDLVDHFGEHQFDRVYSWWMMPHINMEGPDVAEDAAMNLLMVTKYGGELAVGPCFYEGYREAPMIVQIEESDSGLISFEHQAAGIVEGTRLPPVQYSLQRFHNQVYQVHRRIGL